MSDGLYAKSIKAFEDGDIDLLVNTVKVELVDTGLYTVSFSTHEFRSDIPSGARLFESPALSGKTTTGGVFNASPVACASVPRGDTVGALVLYVDTGNASTDRIFAYTNTGAGRPHPT